MKRLFVLFFFLTIGSGISFAQQSTVEGTVVNSDSEPLSYINVTLEGTVKGASTNNNGHYKIKNVEPGTYVLAATAVGYQPQKKNIRITSGESISFDFTLEKSISNLSEVTVSANRRTENLDEVTTSVTVVDNQMINRQETMNNTVQDLLANTVPGLGPATNTTSNVGQTLRGRNMVIMVDGILCLDRKFNEQILLNNEGWWRAGNQSYVIEP